MTKECYQLKRPEPTFCFTQAGSVSCQEDDCLVENRTRDLQSKGITVSQEWTELLLHSKCRISDLSTDNAEYRQRIKNKSIGHLSF